MKKVNAYIKVAAIIMIVFSSLSLLVIGIGQMLPKDQPEWAKTFTNKMISKTETMIEREYQAGRMSEEEYKKEKENIQKGRDEIDNPSAEAETKTGVIILNAVLSLIELTLAITLLRNPKKVWLAAIGFVLVQPIIRNIITDMIQSDLAMNTGALISSLIIPIVISVLIFKGKLELKLK